MNKSAIAIIVCVLLLWVPLKKIILDNISHTQIEATSSDEHERVATSGDTNTEQKVTTSTSDSSDTWLMYCTLAVIIVIVFSKLIGGSVSSNNE